MGKSTKFAITRNSATGGTKAPKAKSQYERFVETARELGADDSEKAFDEALHKIGKAKPSKEKR